MSGAARVRTKMGRAAGALILLCVLSSQVAAARAQSQSPENDPTAGPPSEVEDARGAECSPDCWDFAFLSSGESARLGLQVSTTWVMAPGDDDVDVGVLASYFAQIYRTRDVLSSHALLYGSLGGGSAGTEGSAGGSLDFGVRLPISDVAGPVLRLGPSASVVGHDRFQRSMFAPLTLTAGFQRIDDRGLVEAGLRAGLLAAGRVRALGAISGLAGALEVGSYLAAHAAPLQIDATVGVIRPGPLGDDARLALMSVTACLDLELFTLCAELQSLQARLLGRHGDRPLVRASYAGMTAALGS